MIQLAESICAVLEMLVYAAGMGWNYLVYRLRLPLPCIDPDVLVEFVRFLVGKVLRGLYVAALCVLAMLFVWAIGVIVCAWVFLHFGPI